ncbi:hypothetical protein QYM36_011557, partial [Artemia franciscana]
SRKKMSDENQLHSNCGAILQQIHDLLYHQSLKRTHRNLIVYTLNLINILQTAHLVSIRHPVHIGYIPT